MAKRRARGEGPTRRMILKVGLAALLPYVPPLVETVYADKEEEQKKLIERGAKGRGGGQPFTCPPGRGLARGRCEPRGRGRFRGLSQ